MLPLAFTTDAESAKAALDAGARALLIRAASAEDVITIAGGLPRNVILVADVADADAAALRKLARHVDAAVAPPSVHTAPGFAELVGELDP